MSSRVLMWRPQRLVAGLAARLPALGAAPRLKRLAMGIATVLALLLVQPAAAQPRTPPALLSARQDLRECIIRYAGWASARAEATPDTVADAAAGKCEDKYVKTVTRRRLMDKAQAKVEVNSMAYDVANKILSH